MADWRKNMKTGAFNGAKMETRSVSKTGQQRFAAHKFVATDGQWAEPLGAEAPGWDVDAFVIGDDYMQKRDALEKELDKASTGVFVDPFRSREFRCIVVSYTTTEGITEGLGWALFAITIEESVASPVGAASSVIGLQSANIDTANAATTSAAANTSAYESGTESFSDQAKGVASAVSTWGDQVDDMRETFTGPLAGALDSAADLANALDDFEASITALIDSPAALMAEFNSVWAQVSSSAVARAFTSGRTAAATVAASTASDQAANDALSSVQRASLGAAITRQSTLTTADIYTSSDDALEQAHALIDAITQVQAAASAEEYQAWLLLRAQIAAWADRQAALLPEEIDITVSTPTSVLVLAQRYYQDRDRAADIVARNAATIIHPGFAIGELKILTSTVP